MLNLIICEFLKLKRRKFLVFTIGAAFLFPIPLTWVMARDSQSFDMVFRSIVIFGIFLFLPCILGILSAILFFSERDYDTLKNLMVIPVSKTKLFYAKLCLLFLLSIVYAVTEYAASLIGGLFVGYSRGFFRLLPVSILLGVFVTIAVLPLLLFFVTSRRSYVFALMLTFAYAIISFIFIMMLGNGDASTNWINSILPLGIANKWFLGHITIEKTFAYILPYTLSTPAAVGIMCLYGVVFSFLGSFFYQHAEV